MWHQNQTTRGFSISVFIKEMMQPFFSLQCFDFPTLEWKKRQKEKTERKKEDLIPLILSKTNQSHSKKET
jgi:hypothetical protein